jgi:hypothetical protein
MSDSIVGMNLLETSETIVGLVLEGKQTATLFNPDMFSGKYSNIMRDLKDGKKKEELVGKHGTTLIQSALHAAHSVNGLGTELDWTEIISKKHKSEIVSQELDKVKRNLANGEIDKASDGLRKSVSTLASAQRMRSVSADEIADDYTPFMKSGSLAWDKHIGGWPTVGVIVLAAKTYTGKTTVAISAMEQFMNEYPEKEVLFVTLEDMAEGWKERAKIMLGSKAKEFWHRVKVMEFASSPDEIIQEAARYENVGLVVCDYIDYLAKHKDLESYEDIYKSFGMGSKSLASTSKFRSMPILLLAQFGKGKYQGGVPTQDALMYTGDQYAYQIVMLYHPAGDFYSDNDENGYTLPNVPGKGYLIFWKVKNARPHDPEFPGAIQVPWSGKYGFSLSQEGTWFSLSSDTKRETKKKR